MSLHTNACFAALVLLMLTGWASAADLRPEERTALEAFDRELTDHVMAVRGGKAFANPDRLLKAARDRRVVLSRLVREDPEQAIAVAVDRVRRKQVPPVVAGELEHEVSSMGTFEVVATNVADPEKAQSIHRSAVIDGQRYEVSTWGAGLGDRYAQRRSLHGITLDGVLALAPGRLRVLRPGEPIAPGKRIRDERCPVSGKLAGANQEPSDGLDDVVVESGDTVYYLCQGGHILEAGEQVAAAEGGSTILASAWTEGAKSLVYIPVYFKDQTSGPSLTNMSSVSTYIQACSYNKTSMVTTFTPAFQLSKNAADYDIYTLRSEALAIAKANGYNSANYDLDCVRYGGGPGNFGGAAYVGARGCWLKTNSSGVAAHEFGHNYGLWHANYWNTNDGTTIGTGSNQEYGNIFDVMGSSGSFSKGHFNAYEKNLLSWIPTANTTSVSTSGTYRIYAHDMNTFSSSNQYGINVVKDADRTYWVEYRQNSGWSGNPWLMKGVTLLWDRWASSANGSQLLDTTPGSADGKNDAAIVLGRTFSDTAAGIHITPAARGGTSPSLWMDVVVNMGTYSGNAAPTLNLTANNTQPALNGVVTFTATASDSNGDALAYHWDFGDKTFGPNASTATKSWSTTGTKTVKCIVTDMKGGTVTKTISVNVGVPITVAFSAASQTSANESGTMTVTAQLSATSSQIVSVPFTVTGSSSAADRTISASPITIAAGATTGTATITITADTLDEANETVILTMGTPTNATLGATTVHTATITDDDATPSVAFTLTSSSGSEAAGDTVWFNDALPAGATPNAVSGTNEAWNFVTSNPAPYSGTASHQSTIAAGTHQHYFTGANPTFRVNSGDRLFAYVYLDPANPPTEVMLQWNDGVWEHRAFWGADSIAWGTTGTNSRRSMGALPPTGQWVRLEVPAALVGLDNRDVNGMAFTVFNGRATWDYVGKSSPANLAVALSAASSQAVTVNYAVTSGTATGGGVDYTLASGTLTFPAGTTSQNIAVAVVNDKLAEASETIQVTLSSPTNATLGTNTSHTYTITDDDNAAGPPVAGYSRWFDASQITGVANGGAVSTWVDRSGNNAHATVPSGNAAPVYVADATGTGLGALYFARNSGPSNSAALRFASDSGIRTVFSVFKGSSFLLTAANTYHFHRPGDTNAADPLWISQYASANIKNGTTYVNGTQVDGTVAPMPTTQHNGFNLVAVVTTGSVTADSFNKDRTYHAGNQYHAEVIIYDRVLTNAERLSVENYLNNKWFVAPSAPTGSALIEEPAAVEIPVANG